MLKTILFTLIGGALLTWWTPETFQSPTTPTSTETPTPALSLFKGDFCSPPCWFGLTPGQSTSEDILATVESNEDFYRDKDFADGIFIENTEILVEGYYSFFSLYSVFVIEDGILQWMRVEPNDAVSLGKVIKVWEQPDYVRATISIYEVYLTLFYEELNIVVFLKADREDCRISTISNDFEVWYLFYYAPESFETLETSQDFERDAKVPSERWNSWLDNKLDQSCEDEIRQLYISEPATPSMKPRPTQKS
jgi:hypothetical protein